MIATINGVTVMGTPQEIMEYKQLHDMKLHQAAYQQLSHMSAWVGLQPVEVMVCKCMQDDE
jgi:hypothetical protein